MSAFNHSMLANGTISPLVQFDLLLNYQLVDANATVTWTSTTEWEISDENATYKITNESGRFDVSLENELPGIFKAEGITLGADAELNMTTPIQWKLLNDKGKDGEGYRLAFDGEDFRVHGLKPQAMGVLGFCHSFRFSGFQVKNMNRTILNKCNSLSFRRPGRAVGRSLRSAAYNLSGNSSQRRHDKDGTSGKKGDLDTVG